MKRSNTEMGGGEDAGGGGNNRINKSSSSSSSTSISTILLRPLLVGCLTYLDSESIRQVCLLSKEFLDIVQHDPGMENNRVVPLLFVSSSKEQDAGRIERLLNKLVDQNQNRVHHIRAVKVINREKFLHDGDRTELGNTLTITLRQRFAGVVALDLSSPTKTNFSNYGFLMTLRKMLPNLRELDLSNTNIQAHQLGAFAKECSQLEKITYNNNLCRLSIMPLRGEVLSPAKNLLEIHMDCSTFPYQHAFFFKRLSDLTNVDYSNFYLFQKCNKRLERVSFKSAKYQNTFEWMTFDAIPQNVLIKFVRNTPTLKWFCSDLTHENIAMLRSERHQQEGFSEIKFVQ